jgi:hypothetical protein
MLANYGIDPSWLQSKSTEVLPRSETEEGYRWQQNNRDLFEYGAFPHSAYYAQPDNPLDEFYYEAYLRQFRDELGGTPAREALTPEQQLQKRNDLLGNVLMETQRRALETEHGKGNPYVEQWLAAYRDELMRVYPGYNRAVPGVPKRADPTTIIDTELAKWYTEPRLLNTEVGRGLVIYLGLREQAKRQSEAHGLRPMSFSSAKVTTRYIRDWLRLSAERISRRYPKFRVLWERILKAELREDEEE